MTTNGPLTTAEACAILGTSPNNLWRWGLPHTVEAGAGTGRALWDYAPVMERKARRDAEARRRQQILDDWAKPGTTIAAIARAHGLHRSSVREFLQRRGVLQKSS